MTAIEKSNDGLSPLPKLLISHGLPVLSVVTLKWYENHPGSTTTPPPPPKKKKKEKKVKNRPPLPPTKKKDPEKK